MQVSFVIPHKGREEMLRQTVASIAAQDFDLSKVEVIIASQNEKMLDTSFISQTLPNIKTIPCSDSLTISALRNIGAAKSSGDYIAFLDADVELSPNWLRAMLENLKTNKQRVLLSAAQRNSNNAPVLERIRTALSNAEINTTVQFLPGRNLLLHKDTYTKVGGFPEHLITCEDYYFTGQVSQLGELYYSSEANYIHIGEDKELKKMFFKEIWRGESNLASLKGRKIPLQELPSFLTPLWILGFSIISILASVSLNASLTIASLLLLMLPIFLYSFRLLNISGQDITFKDTFLFYLTYFPARIIGTLKGVKALMSHHEKN